MKLTFTEDKEFEKDFTEDRFYVVQPKDNKLICLVHGLQVKKAIGLGSSIPLYLLRHNFESSIREIRNLTYGEFLSYEFKELEAELIIKEKE